MRSLPFETVVAEHGPMVLRICRAMLGPNDAEDAWSETFLAAMRAYPDLREGSNIAAWLTTIAHRKAIDQTRRRRRSPVPVGAIQPVPVIDTGLEPDDDDLRAALAALSERQRTAVVYHHVVGLPYAEIAEMLETSEAAARRSAADGIAKLRTLQPKGQDR